MAISPFYFFFLFSLFIYRSSAQTTPSIGTRFTDLFPRLSFAKDAHVLFGAENVKIFNNGFDASISLNKITGSGMTSSNKYYYGFFSVAMKLPPGYSAGVVVAFYLSNSDAFPHSHDEIDFELLGHSNRTGWILQTNIYGNGSVNIGREEKFNLWFDPSSQFHEYSILWNTHHIVYFVDNIPVREVLNTKAMPTYPSKPMTLYATIWDGSNWATDGGKSPVDYKYEPFVSSLGKLEMSGHLYKLSNTTQTCPKKTPSVGSSSGGIGGPLNLDPVDGQPFVRLSRQQIRGLAWVRTKHMVYSYCKDRARYKVLPPECNSK